MLVVIKMDKLVKRQLALSTGLLLIVLITLMAWYDNFIFHTYIDQKQYQSYYQGVNEDIQIEGFEFYQNPQGSYLGNGRVMSLKNDFFLKGDRVRFSFVNETSQKDAVSFQQDHTIQEQNEVCYLELQKLDQKYEFDQVNQLTLRIQIERKNKVIYDKNMTMDKVELMTYTGSNKDYTIQNVYATSSWLKTGVLSFDEKITQEYQYCTVDYLILKENGQPDDLDDYERFAYISQKMTDMKKTPQQEAYFYDQADSLLDKDIRCVITLKKDETDQQPLVFTIDLHKIVKDGDNHA